MMVGRDLGELFPKRQPNPGEEVLAVKDFSRADRSRQCPSPCATVRSSGCSGWWAAGARRWRAASSAPTLPARASCAWRASRSGCSSPRDAVQAGIAFLTEDRKRDGLVMSCSIRDNASLATMNLVSRLGVLDVRKRDSGVQAKVDELSIHPAQISRLVRQLSGGNQQKVILAKWLLSEARVLILDEPTRGVDVATKLEIYRLIGNLADRGVGILLISSELPEILGMSDRALVMREGALAGEFSRAQASEERLLACAAGVVQ